MLTAKVAKSWNNLHKRSSNSKPSNCCKGRKHDSLAYILFGTFCRVKYAPRHIQGWRITDLFSPSVLHVVLVSGGGRVSVLTQAFVDLPFSHIVEFQCKNDMSDVLLSELNSLEGVLVQDPLRLDTITHT